MAEVKEQCASVKFCFLLGKWRLKQLSCFKQSPKTLTWTKQTFMSGSQVLKIKSHLSIEDQLRLSWSSTTWIGGNITKSHELILEDHCWTIDWCVLGSCQWILSDEMYMQQVAAKSVPHLLKEGQKQSQTNVCYELKEQLEDDLDLLMKVITDDKSWWYKYNTETKQQSSQWEHSALPHPIKAHQVKSMSRWCWFVSSMQKGSSTQNLFLRVKLLIRLFTLQFWGVCETW